MHFCSDRQKSLLWTVSPSRASKEDLLDWPCTHREGPRITRAACLIGFLHEATSFSLHHLTEPDSNCLCLCFHWGLFDLAVWGHWTARRHEVGSVSHGGPSHGLWFVLASPQHNCALSGCLTVSIHWGRRWRGWSCDSGRQVRQDFNPRAASGDLRVWRQKISCLWISFLWKKVIILCFSDWWWKLFKWKFLKHLFSNGCTTNSGDQSGRLPSLYGDASAPGRRTWDSCAHAQGGSISASASIQPPPCGMDL